MKNINTNTKLKVLLAASLCLPIFLLSSFIYIDKGKVMNTGQLNVTMAQNYTLLASSHL